MKPRVPLASYPEHLDGILRPRRTQGELVLDLFAGCGGLALGFESAGFSTLGFEKDPDCNTTYRANLHGDCRQEFLTVDTAYPKAEVIIGGPPCQPFSVGGKQMGLEDSRDGFPAFISAVERVQPKIWMFENVRGLLYRNKWYLDQVIQKLEGMGYIVEYRLLNAVKYLVPQNRERLIVVGHRGGYRFPEACDFPVTAGMALGQLAFEAPTEGKYLTESQDNYILKYEIASKCTTPRDLHLNKPSRTLTCRNLAGATGDMQRVRLSDGRRRRLTVREAARLQSFPDWFQFHGTETSQYYQIGNAVPPMFALALGQSMMAYLAVTSDTAASSTLNLQRPTQPPLALEG